MIEIPKNVKTNFRMYEQFYYVFVIKRLLKFYDLKTSLKMVCNRMGKSGIKLWLKNKFNYFTDKPFTNEIYKEIIKDYNYKPKNFKILASFKNLKISKPLKVKIQKVKKLKTKKVQKVEKPKDLKINFLKFSKSEIYEYLILNYQKNFNNVRNS